MIKIFSLFERKDIEKSEWVDNLYDNILYFLKNETDFNKSSKSLNLPLAMLSGKDLFITYENHELCIFLCFKALNSLQKDLIYDTGYGKTEISPKISLSKSVNTIFIKYYKENLNDSIRLGNLIDLFEEKEEGIKHEITHLYDKLNYNNASKNSDELLKTDKKNIYNYEKYFNDTLEINANFMTGVSIINKKIKDDNYILSSFIFFKKTFIESIQDFYDFLTEKNKKKINSRIYLLYTELIKKYHYF